MNHVERFRAVMNFQPVDRLPRWEWAMWWDETIARWHQEGLPHELKFGQVFDIAQYFGLDPDQQFWFSTTQATIAATQHHVEGFFWFPRTLMDFEKLMFAFADQPELLHHINTDLMEFNLRLLDEIFRVCVPTFMTITEDVSSNNGR